MLISVSDLKALYPEFDNISDELLQRKLMSIEIAIRQYTHNNFQNRLVRCECSSVLNELEGELSPFFMVGDTIQISESVANNGLCVIEDIQDNILTVDRRLFTESHNLVTKIEYPIDLVDGAIGVLKWDVFEKDKINVASESISRHSVSYVQYDAGNTVNGYPTVLFGFCSKYMKART